MKALAVDLGRTPTRAQAEGAVAGFRYKLERLFNGSHALLLKAAGLETYNERRSSKPRGNEIFEADLGERLERFKPRESSQTLGFSPTLVIGDTHFPFASERVLEAIYAFTEKHQPKRIVQVGDLFDQYAHSRFPRSHNLYTPKEEEKLAREGAEKMWARLQALAPGAECYQLMGNHDLRAMKLTLANMPSLEHAVKKYLEELMAFPGVTTITDERQELVLDGVAYIHGYASGFGKHRDHMGMNAVVGHTHLGAVTYRRRFGTSSGGSETLWELNAGLVGDPEAKAFSYTPQRIVNWTQGFGFIWPWGPQFIPV